MENEQSSFSSESYKNSSFSKNFEEGTVNKTQESGRNKNDNSGRDGDRPNRQDKTNDVPKTNPNTSTEYISRTIIGISEKEIKRDKGRNGENTTSYKELRHFQPLSDKDISNLNFYADRDFSSNFVNQLLLKLYIKYPDKKFRNKFTFLSYMKKILRNEKHQGPLVNHTNFRFICNISVEDKNMQYYEKYLSSIENSLDISKETQIKKKIAGRFNTKLAYHIIKQVNFKANFDNSFITALIPTNKNLDLSESQIESLSQQLEAVYGMNGCYLQEVDDMQDSDNGKAEVGIISPKITNGIPLSMIPTTTSWYNIKKELIEELGINTDKAWFYKVVGTEDKETSTLTLILPTKFMADWVRNNYSHVIQRLAENCGIKRAEYSFE